MKWFHKAARMVYRANRATRTVEAVASGNPKRVERLVGRRILYHYVAKLANRLFR